MEKELKVGVLIPAYNEEKSIAGVVLNIKRFVSFVIVIDDGSSDRTACLAREAGAFVIVHKDNKGKGAAIKTGFGEMIRQNMDAVIIMDGDGQHDASEIPAFIKKTLETSADIIIGNRMDNPEGMPFIRNMTNKFTSCIISKVIKARISDTQCGFRLIRTWLIPKMDLTTMLYDTESEMLLEAAELGASFENVSIKSIYTGSESHIKKIRDTLRFFSLVFRYIFRKKRE